MAAAIGEAAASHLLTMALDKAVTLFSKEFARLSGVNEKIHRLTYNMELVNGYLRDAEATNQTEREGVRLWLGKLENIAYDIEDLLDECGAEATLQPGGSTKLPRWRRRLHDGVCLVSDCFLSCCISNPTSVSFRREIAKEFESVEQRLGESIQMGSSLGLVNLSGSSQLHQSRTRSGRETSPFREEGSLFVGREETMREIKVKLLACVDRDDDSSNNCSSSVSRGNSCEGHISVVAIVGFGGMGKTTLARAILDDKEVKARFTMTQWVFVGEDFDTKRIIRDIIGDEGSGINMINSTLSGLQARLKARVREHRFLIVWDDVWNNNPADWNELWVPLSDAREGSVIVVTTRKLDVAKTMGPHVSIHELDRLSDDHCWRIFERRAFRGVKSERDHHRLEGIGRKIVEKLKGVPLAASMIGGFLGSHLHDARKWEWVLNGTEWPLTAEGSIADKVIDLSYRHLPPHLRLCFAYCGIFPKGFRFDRKYLVLMWMAQSYVRPEKGRELEDTGDDYFEDLYRSSFFQFINENYVMHDIIHDYAQKVFKSGKRVISETDRIVASAGDQEEQVRHLSFSCSSLQATEVEELRKFRKLRTLHLICRWAEAIDLDFLAEFKYLRVLQLEGYGCSELPKSSKSNWKLLKYLDIGQTEIRYMPDYLVSSGTLCNLQTLRLRYDCSAGEGVSKLVSLRHVHGDPVLISCTPGLGKLTSLQELGLFTVARSDGRKIVELKGLNCLRGSLRIDGIEEVESKGEAEAACLKDKVHLEGLYLSWSVVPRQQAVSGTLETEVLEALRPPPNLKELAICGNCGIRLPNWMMEPALPLSNLVKLSLVWCTGWEHLPPLGRLPYLKHLTIWTTSRVRKVGTEFLGIDDDNNILDGNQCHHQQAGEVFRSLETLEFAVMPEWEVWDAAGIWEEETRTLDRGCGQEVVFFPSLRSLDLKGCPKLKELPVEIMLRLTTLRDLTIVDCSSLASSSFEEGVPTSRCHTWPLERFDTDNRSLMEWLLLQHPQKTKRFPFLRHLTIAQCDKLTSFTDVEEDGLKHLISLKKLEIFACPNLRYLPSSLHALPSLQVFRLQYCPEIECLPDGGLPPSLLDFLIEGCPRLEERCREGGPDYHKIQSIEGFRIS